MLNLVQSVRFGPETRPDIIVKPTSLNGAPARQQGAGEIAMQTADWSQPAASEPSFRAALLGFVASTTLTATLMVLLASF